MARTKIRLNLEISECVSKRLERLKEISGSPSRTEVIRRALSLYDQILELQQQDVELFAKKKDGVEQKILIV